MAEEKKYKTTFLLLGVLIGLVVGMMALIVVQSLNNSSKDKDGNMSETAVERIADKVLTLFYLKKKEEDTKPEDTKKIVYVSVPGKPNNDNTTDTLNAEKTIENNKSDSLAVLSDSLSSEELAINDENEDIQVKKDKIIASKTFDVAVLGSLDLKTPTDSILEKNSGVQIDKNTSRKVTITAELWESPINYRGYKMNKAKTVLFGLEDVDLLKFYLIEGEYYIKYENNVFRLQNTNDFRPYERVSKPAVLSQIK